MVDIEWTRPGGRKIKTNDRKETIAYCESLGWKRKAKPGPKPKVKGDGRDGE